MTALISCCLLIIVTSAIASGTEAALFSISVSKLKSLPQDKRVKATLHIKENIESSIRAIVIVNNITNIIGSIMVGYLAEKEFMSWHEIYDIPYVGIFSAVFTLLVISYSEIVPKTIGERYPEDVSLRMASTVIFLEKFLKPVDVIISLLTRPITRHFSPVTTHTSEDEIRALAEMGRDQSVIDDEELELIERVFELDDLTVRDMMIHANKVDSLDSQKTLAEVRQIIFDCTHTRLPVYENRVNNIVGVVHQRELLRALAEDKDQLTVQELASQPLFVLPTTKGDDMLNVFLKQKKHLAVVVDIQGSMLGVITLEDVIEELVGNIEDETDLEIEDVQLIGPNKVLAIPEAMCEDVNQRLGTNLPTDNDKSISDILFDRYTQIPSRGESFILQDAEIIIQTSNPRNVEEVLIKRINNLDLDADTESVIVSK